MLTLKNIRKEYIVGNQKVEAIKGINISFRKSEFVSILGASGGGKTTLLNIIGGLDQASCGDLIINGKSTQNFKDSDWDAYRNHSVGFVFQSYNLIPHQTVLSNVELSLTISNIDAKERKERAVEALIKVGLKDHMNKKPNQLSGGQMQRVAIARSLVNNPKILLADEPTGALDTKTSVQIMDLLKEIANDRLVIMVTHNPELAQTYSTRIIQIADGCIIDDNNPYKVQQHGNEKLELKRTSMNLKTAISLSLNNLMTKKGRTLLTSLAGSIGIIGIALILALSSGVNGYIETLQQDTMVSYPITIESTSVDVSSMMGTQRNNLMNNDTSAKTDNKSVYGDNSELESESATAINVYENNLSKFKSYLDDASNEVHNYVGENGIVYNYNIQFEVYSYDSEERLVAEGFDDNSASQTMPMMSGMSKSSNTTTLQPIISSNNKVISDVVSENYEVIDGKWAENYNEVVLVLDENNQISTKKLYQYGLLPKSQYDEYKKKIEKGEEVTFEDVKIEYEDVYNQELYLIPTCDLYQKQSNGLYQYVGEDELKINSMVNNAVKLKITGVVKAKEDSNYSDLSTGIAYTHLLTDYLIQYTDNSDVVKAQNENMDVDVLSGISFVPKDDAQKIEDTKKYLLNLSESDKASVYMMIMSLSGQSSTSQGTMGGQDSAMTTKKLEEYLDNPDNTVLLKIYDQYINVSSYNDNMQSFGKISLDSPSSISIYTDSFDDKEKISDCITDYNKGKDKDDQITYTDYVGLMTSSITSIVNIISYVLIAFVAVSLIVSCIMIAIITHISVMERTREIGILRAIGATKRDVSRVFNAETLIIGLCSGLLGVITTYILQIPVNAIIHSLIGSSEVSASLSLTVAIVLICISVILTMLSGLFPARGAAKKDPVVALRSE